MESFESFASIILRIAVYSIFPLVICAFKPASLPVVINTWHVKEANKVAYRRLLDGGSALDAVVEGCKVCERTQCGGTVGYGGSPDENGETTLDAMIMDGKTMNAGAVGALRYIKSAVSVARRVLENTEHTFLVGSQATDFAVKMGFSKESLSTNRSEGNWKIWKSQKCQPNFWMNVVPNPKGTCGPYHPDTSEMAKASNSSYFSNNNHDTIGVVAMDRNKNIAVATSTNGASHKIPGRVGDSPVIGSGGYARNGVGGAAATGDGDILMRFLPCFKAVEGLRMNLTAPEAAKYALDGIKDFYPRYVGAVVVLSASGEYGAACHGIAKFPFFIAQGDQPSELLSVDC